MTEQSPLERRYRRWLALYPAGFRDAHMEEMIAVLMQSAESGRRRPGMPEAANLAAHGLGRRLGGRFPSDWERAHARVMFPVRIAIALWLCFLSAIFIAFHPFHGAELWLILLVPAIALHLYIAYRIRPGTVRT